MHRNTKRQPVFKINGWTLERRPHALVEQHTWTLYSVTPDGYVTRHGFDTQGEAIDFAQQHQPSD